MHEGLVQLVSNKFSKLSDDLSAEHAAKRESQRADFAGRGLIESGVFKVTEVNLYLDYATDLIEGRARIWAEAIQDSEGRFTHEDAEFVASDLDEMIAAQRVHAHHAAESTGADSNQSAHFVQRVSQWEGGLRGSIQRDLQIRAEQSVLDAKAEDRRQAAADLAAVPVYVRRLLGRWAKHRWAMSVYAAIILLLAVVGVVSLFFGTFNAIKEASKPEPAGVAVPRGAEAVPPHPR